ncbi:AAA family ATPase [Cellulomonas sp.]|uniref:AAA family ATPase n=1 Tax=Cellulomonas sp. TaxID=40001 RepID=UPI003BA975BA
MSLQGPWVGRQGELARVTSTLTGEGGRRGTVIAGPAGVGKTRLAAEAAERVAALDRSVLSFVATASAKRLPLGVFAGLRVPSTSADPFRVVGAVLDALLSGTDGSGTVVAVDDVHQLDETSAVVVHQLVHKTRAVVLLTLRVGEPVPETVAALWKDGLVERVDLEPLAEPESAELLRVVLGGPVDAGAAAKLWDLTHGNVLHARRIIDDERRAGRLEVRAGTWVWHGDPVLSPTLLELITAQMGAIPADVADVVDLLAIAEPLPFDAVLDGLGGAPVERAEAAGLIMATPAGRPDACGWRTRCTATCDDSGSARCAPRGCAAWPPGCSRPRRRPRGSASTRRSGGRCSPSSRTCRPMPPCSSRERGRRRGCCSCLWRSVSRRRRRPRVAGRRRWRSARWRCP